MKATRLLLRRSLHLKSNKNFRQPSNQTGFLVPNDDSDIIHIPMNEEDLLDYEVDEVVNFKATLGHKTLRRTPSEYPVLHLAHSRCTNTLLSQVHAHTFTNSHFNLKCFCYFAEVQAGGTKGCANVDRNYHWTLLI